MSEGQSAFENISRGTGSVAAWVYANEATAGLARRTQEWLREGNFEEATRLAEQYANNTVEQRAGHVYEFIEALRFNDAAATTGDTVRAATTASQGQTSASADIILSSGDATLREIQAKLYDETGPSIYALGQPKYEGMDRLVPSDQEASARELLAKRLEGDPEAIYFSRYEDVEEHLTGQLEYGGVSSGGTTRAKALETEQDPVAWLQREVLTAGSEELAAATGLGVAVGGGFGLLASGVQNGLAARRGDVDVATAVIDTAIATGTAAARGGAVTGLAKAVQMAARDTAQFAGFAQTLGPVAVANGVLQIGAAGLDAARGNIGPQAFCERSGGAVVQNASMWAFGVAGQAVIPVPLLGSMVGGMMGYAAATMTIEGLKLASAAARAADAAEDELQQLERWILHAIKRLEETRLVIERVTALEAAHFADTLLPLMDDVEGQLRVGRDAVAFERLIDLARELGIALNWKTPKEFDSFMASGDPLVL